jgi:uncharacterized protein
VLDKLQQRIAETTDTHNAVLQWDPPFCGDIPLHIDHKGQWHYAGTPFTRQRLVNLFARILRCDNNQYFLVTPVEKVGITVADVPLIITQWSWLDDSAERCIQCTTATNDVFCLDADHPMTLRNDPQQALPLPYIKVRHNLWAKLHQNVYYQWIEAAQEHQGSLWLHSGGHRFKLGEL